MAPRERSHGPSDGASMAATCARRADHLAALGRPVPQLRRVEHARGALGARPGRAGTPTPCRPWLSATCRPTRRARCPPASASSTGSSVAASSTGSVTLLFGPPGIGKSTLLFQVLSSVASPGRRRHARLGRGVAHPGQRSGRRASARCPTTCSRSRAPTSRRSRRPSRATAPPSWSWTRSSRSPTPSCPAGRQLGSGARLCRASDPAGQVQRRPAPLGGSRHQGRRPGGPAGRRAPRRHRAVLRRRSPPRAARAHIGQAPLRPDGRGRHLRDARRRPARRSRPRAAHAGGPHGRRPRQRGRARPAGSASAARRGAGPVRGRGPAVAPGPAGPTPWAWTARGRACCWRSWPAAPASTCRCPASSSSPPSAASRVTEPAADLAVALALASVVRQRPVSPELVVFGELGLAGEVRTVPGADRRLAEAHAPASRRRWCPPRRCGDGGDPGRTPVHGWCMGCAPWQRRWPWPVRRRGRVRCRGGRRCRRQPTAERRAGDDRAGLHRCGRASTGSCRPSTAR